jgi:hypothetical protein
VKESSTRLRESRTIWKNLLIICPPLHRARARRSSATTPPRSAASRSQASRLEYPDWVPEELKNGYMWHPDNSGNQWWWTHSPSSLPASSRTLQSSASGMKQDAVENPVANASVGTMPKVMVYIAVHAVHGVFVSGSTLGPPW